MSTLAATLEHYLEHQRRKPECAQRRTGRSFRNMVILQGTSHFDQRRRVVEVVDEDRDRWIGTPQDNPCRPVLEFRKYAWTIVEE